MIRNHALSGVIFTLILLTITTMTIAGPLEEKARQIRTLAEQGDAKSQSHLGYLYYVGEGVPQDYSQAVTWYRKAATQGDKDAQYNLAVAYAFGEGIEQDLKQAAIWYRRAAEQGHVISQYSLGLSYAYGEGVPQDSSEAVRWFTHAAEQGYIRAQVHLGSAYHTGEGVTQDYSQAIHWYRMAADRGDATAQYNLGTLYRAGKGVEQNYPQAIRWFTMAADQGYAAAQNELASLQRTVTAVAARPTPQVRPGSTESVVNTGATISTPEPAVTTIEPDPEPEHAPAVAESAPVAVTQTPTPLRSISSDGISSLVDRAGKNAAENNTAGTESPPAGEGGGLFGAIGRIFKTREQQPETATAIVGEPVDAGDDSDALPDTPAPPVETEIIREDSEAVATGNAESPTETEITDTAQTDQTSEPEVDEALLTDADSIPASPEVEEQEKKPGFFSRLFGAGKTDGPEDTISEASEDVTGLAMDETRVEDTADRIDSGEIDTGTAQPETTAIDTPAVPESPGDEPLTTALDSQEDATVEAETEAEAEAETIAAIDSPAGDDASAKSDAAGTGGFFSRIFGSNKPSATSEPETVALAESASTIDRVESAEPVESAARHSVEAGRRALAGGDYDQALAEFRPLAEAGDAEAQSHLASMYYVGRAVDKDYDEAFNWYLKAAEQGHMDSEYSIGNMYLLGESVPQDNQKAALWYDKAARQGHVAAAHNLQSLKTLMAQSGEPLELPQPVEVATLTRPETTRPDTMAMPDADTTTASEDMIHDAAPAASTPAAPEISDTAPATPTVAVVSNMPETDAIVRAHVDDEAETSPDSDTATAMDQPVEEKARTASGVGGFFSRLFGGGKDSTETDTAMDSDTLTANDDSDDAVPDIDAGLAEASDSPYEVKPPAEVKTYGVASAPVSQQLTSDPEQDAIDAVAPGEAETPELSIAAATTTTTEPATGTDSAEAVTADESGETIRSTDAGDSGTGKGFFARLFGTGDDSARTPDNDAAAGDEIEPVAEIMEADGALSGATGDHDSTAGETPKSTDEAVEPTDEDEFAFFDQMFSNSDRDATTAMTEQTPRQPPPQDESISGTEAEAKAEADAEPEPAEAAGETANETVAYITDSKAVTDTAADVGTIRPLATRGDADAQLQLADMYYTGNGLKQDYTQAFLWYRRAAQQGNMNAQYKLGNIYLMGEGIEQDDVQAAQWYERAAEQGHEAARHNYENLQRLAAEEFVAGNQTESTPQPAATPSMNPGFESSRSAGGDAAPITAESSALEPDTADNDIAAGNEEKKGFWAAAGELLGLSEKEKDPAQAEPQVTLEDDDLDGESAQRRVENAPAVDTDSADPEALYEMGMAHAFGDGVSKDDSKAFEYFQQAAELGHAGAQYRLGVAYAYGEGVERDTDLAIRWYRESAQNGNAVAQRTLASMYLDGNGVPRDRVMAHAWYRIVADSGNVMDIRRRDMLQEKLSATELTESERIAGEIHARLQKL